jgi:hypothetical protein
MFNDFQGMAGQARHDKYFWSTSFQDYTHMKNGIYKVLSFLILTISISCSSSYQLSIEVLEPASVTLPLQIKRVLVVNNTVGQPNHVGIARIYEEKMIENYELDLDSVSWITVEMLTSRIGKSNFFDNVSFYRKWLRNDTEWMTGIPLSPEIREEIFDIQGFDAIISIDRLLFRLEEEVKNVLPESNNYLSVFVDNQLEGALTGSVYLYNRETPLSSFTITDSLFHKVHLQADSSSVFKELPESLIDNLAYALSKKLAQHIIPSWRNQERILYTGSNSRMREAFSYTKTGKWDTAEFLWLSEFDKETKNRNKAQIASNIAVANEMQDKLEVALRWAEKAKEYTADHSKERTIVDKHISNLQKRIQNNRLLDIQWGEN